MSKTSNKIILGYLKKAGILIPSKQQNWICYSFSLGDPNINKMPSEQWQCVCSASQWPIIVHL